MRITRSAGLAVCVGNAFVRFSELPPGVPVTGDGDYEVMQSEDDASGYPEPALYLKPAPPVPAATEAPGGESGEVKHERKRKSRVRSG